MQTPMTPEALSLLVRAFAEGTAALVTQSQLGQYMPGLELENDPDLVDPIQCLVDNHLVKLIDNPNPMTREFAPRLVLLTHDAVLWCTWYFYKQHWEALQVEELPTENMGEFMEQLCEARLA